MIEQSLISASLHDIELTDEIRHLLAAEIEQWGSPMRVRRTDSSNALVELRFTQDRSLIIKQTQHYPETAPRRLRASQRAAQLLREQAGVLAPDHLVFPGNGDHAVVAYRRIELPTLDECWSDVPDSRKSAVLRDFGRMIRRMHDVRFPACGSILEDEAQTSLRAFLEEDLAVRLRPAVYGEWSAGVPVTDRLIELIPRVAERARHRSEAVLLHGDLHLANVLCEAEGADLRCVGVLDLESAFAGPPEADFARLSIQHGPLFGRPLSGPWFSRVWEGYGQPLDPLLLAFFRAWHFVNIGFHSAMMGHKPHADRLARAAEEEVRAFDARGEARPGAGGGSGAA